MTSQSCRWYGHWVGEDAERPLYLRIREDLEREIRAGRLAPGARLPTEHELRDQYDVSRATVQRAVTELAQAGLVERHRSRGTFVIGPVRQANLLPAVNPMMTGPAIPGRHEIHRAAVVPAAEAVPDLPGVNARTPVVYLVRPKLDEDELPILMEWSAVPFGLAPHLLDEELTHLQVVPYLRSIGVAVTRSRMYMDAISLDAETAELVGSTTGAPALLQRRYSWLDNGEIAESARYLIRPGLVDFYLESSL